ncbi:HPF/RaiA family ribosome-associated protein, partial [Akkermansia muciniphila]|uniref:HPF/RaiA family ribosome-associated protein n=1 Tax=Akkermansia muciniphila TaxID=239935 RepID=UPI0021092A9E
FVTKKIEGIGLDFPRIMEVKVLIDVQRDRKISQVILICSDHITIHASTEGTDMYACLDETITKIMRRMLKHKPRLMKN